MFKRLITVIFIHFLFVALEHGFHKFCIGGDDFANKYFFFTKKCVFLRHTIMDQVLP